MTPATLLRGKPMSIVPQVLFPLSITVLMILSSTPLLVESRSVVLPSPQCHPSIVQNMPDRYRKICDALATILDLSDAMDNYIDEKEAENTAQIEPLLSNLELRQPPSNFKDMMPLMKSGVKRKEDVDHVFLRFGKRG
ncbi:myosuppressin isoform X1 [Lepeophtheirus salmonis]|uniref:Myosuppressin n=1 Tax=Lepeophtheirus salmonis TaxID=72036 RepID=A0A0K2SWV4_LEPSM|nr:myosuppressin-like isoform X1 [Lepeophtheirus salmonis]QCP68924.1 myosuppressin [Lepeophtheirus salmonis]